MKVVWHAKGSSVLEPGKCTSTECSYPLHLGGSTRIFVVDLKMCSWILDICVMEMMLLLIPVAVPAVHCCVLAVFHKCSGFSASD